MGRKRKNKQPSTTPETPSSEAIQDTGLSDKQQAFINEYFLCGFNQTEAYRRAGYEGEYDTLAANASRLIRNDKVRAEIDRRMAEYTMSANEVIARLSSQGRADIDDLHNETGEFDYRIAKQRGQTHLIKKMKRKRTYRTDEDGERLIDEYIEVELHDVQSALQLLGKYHALFTDRVRNDDWRTQAIQDIRNGLIHYAPLAKEFGDEFAAELFRAAGKTPEDGMS